MAGVLKGAKWGLLFATLPFCSSTKREGCQFGVLIEQPFRPTDFRKALGRDGVLPCHQTTEYHKTSLEAAALCRQTCDEPDKGIDSLLNKQKQQQFQNNKDALTSIVQCILYLGRQAIAFRGHRDTMSIGNLQALIKFRAETDTNLRHFIDTYVSSECSLHFKDYTE